MIPDTELDTGRSGLLGEAYLFVHVELAEDFCGVEQMLVIKDPASGQSPPLAQNPGIRTSSH